MKEQRERKTGLSDSEKLKDILREIIRNKGQCPYRWDEDDEVMCSYYGEDNKYCSSDPNICRMVAGLL